MPINTPDQTVAKAIAEALVEAQLLTAAVQSKVVEKIASGQMTAAEWQTYLKSAPPMAENL
jgi:hypothetical protein